MLKKNPERREGSGEPDPSSPDPRFREERMVFLKLLQ